MADSRLEFETLIADVSAVLMAAAPADLPATIDAALERIRAFFDADRCGLLALSADGKTLDIRYGAVGPGIPRVPKNTQPTRLFPWTSRKALEGHPVSIASVRALPPAASVDRDTWTRMGVLSHLSVPILSGSRVTHLLTMGMLRHEREWPAEYASRIRLLGELMTASILRAGVIDDLQAALDEVKTLRERAEQENGYLRREMARRVSPGLVTGRSAVMQRALTLASQVADTDATVLLMGETGTGKERFASFIHETSARHGRPMVRVNCSAIPSALIESELFGREKGAYTGALTRQVGRFELAHGSTLFLDEIGDLPLEVQVKLLRVLQERTIERLGSPTPIAVDVRIIAATNRDLEAAVRAGAFRSDLFYRLNVFPIVVPPLRERRDDLPGLVAALMEELNEGTRKRFTRVDSASLAALTHYAWPGNVRELRNVLERAMILGAGPTLTVDVPGGGGEALAAVEAPAAAAPAAPGGLRAWERDQILRVLQETGWRIRGPRGAAEVLGLKPTTLEKRMGRLDLRRPTARL